MKYHKLYAGELITIDDNLYMVNHGLSPQQREECNRRENNKMVYNVHLRSVKYNPNKFPPDIYCKNTEVPVFSRIK